MKYLCLMYFESRRFGEMSQGELAAFQADCDSHDTAMKKSGHLIRAEALQSVEKATTLRLRNARLSATDGPFAETKEQLCGFVLIEAPDLDEAIRVASRSPFAKVGSVEVRPVMEHP